MKARWDAGELVRLRGDGPVMTVGASIPWGAHEEYSIADVYWFVGGDLHKATVDSRSLTKAE